MNRADELSLAGNVFEQINSICQQFRRAWKQGTTPNLDEHLALLTGKAQSTLFQNLLHIEIEARRRLKQNPNSDEYIQRFPNFARMIRQAFFESTMMSLEAFNRTPAEQGMAHDLDRDDVQQHDRTVSFILPAANRLGEYILLREIGRGGFGVVYDAKHQQRLNRVALKTLPLGDQRHGLDDAERLHKFRREFRSLADINHPNLIGMQTLEVDGGQWFFTMDLVDGVDFLSYVRPQESLDESRLRAVLPQLASGILELHAQQIAHRDLKPSNVLISDDGHVTILDFGLVIDLGADADLTATLASARFAGTPSYAAPEQMSGQSTSASDWYALGVMLFEALTGERPFRGSVLELYEQKRNQAAARLSERPDLPADLAEFADRLLQREPNDRPNPLDVARFLSLATESKWKETREIEALQTIGPTGQVLFGRDEQLATLRTLGERLLQKRGPRGVFVSGRSGEGKTTLVEKFLHTMRTPRVQEEAEDEAEDEAEPRRQCVPRQEPGNEENNKNEPGNEDAKEPGNEVVSHAGSPSSNSGEKKSSEIPGRVMVLAGRCYDRESVPFKAIDSVIDSLVSQLRSRPTAELAALLPDDMPMLVHLFPVLARVEAIQKLRPIPQASLDRKQVRQRAFAAFRELLAKLSRHRPGILFIDDLQWGDADSAEILFELLHGTEQPSILFVGSYRRDEAGDSPFVKTWETLLHNTPSNVMAPTISVGPLSESQCLAWIVHRIGEDSASIREKAHEIYQATGGNPYFLDQLIDCYDPQSNSFRAAPLHEVLAQKLAKLPAEALPLLQIISVAGKAMSIAEASHAAGLDRAAFATITHMRSERLVRLVGGDSQEQVDTYHDKIRETVLERLPPEQRQTLHRRLGETIESSEPVSFNQLLESLQQSEAGPMECNRVFDLAFHFGEANQPDRALVYTTLAAERAKSQFAIDDAVDHYRKAYQLGQHQSPAVRFRIALGLAETLLHAGLYEEAESMLQESLESASSPRDRLTVQAILATSRFRTHAVRDCIRISTMALRELGVSMPNTNLGVHFLKWKLNLESAARRLKWYSDLPTPADDWKSLLSARLLAQMSHAYLTNNNIRAATSSMSSIYFAKNFPNSPILANALTSQGMALGFTWGRYGRANQYFGEAIQICKRNQDSLGRQLAEFWQGFHMVLTADFDNAIARLERLSNEYRNTGNTYWLNYSRFAMAIAKWHTGELVACIEFARKCFSEGVRTNQFRQAQCVLQYWARATVGKLPLNEIESCFQPIGEEDCSATVSLLIARGFRYQHKGRSEDSVNAFGDAVDTMKRNGYLTSITVQAFPHFASALRFHAVAVALTRPNESYVLRRKALAAARRAVRISRRFPCEVPYSLRELGLAQVGVGKLRAGWKSLAESCRVAAQQGARYEYALSLRALGEVGEKLRRPEGPQQIAQGTAAIREIESSRETRDGT